MYFQPVVVATHHTSPYLKYAIPFHVKFRHAILAAGSHPSTMAGVEFKEGGRIMDSSGALALKDIPETLLVVGGGYIALELDPSMPPSVAVLPF